MPGNRGGERRAIGKVDAVPAASHQLPQRRKRALQLPTDLPSRAEQKNAHAEETQVESGKQRAVYPAEEACPG